MPQLRTIQFTCYGTPTPQGSKRPVMGKHQRFPSIVESSGERLKRWRYAVSQAAAEAVRGHGGLIDGPVQVCLTFHLLRPKSHFGSGKNSRRLKPSAPQRHTQTPDIDKLTRAVLDSLTGQVYRDDSQVSALRADKYWIDANPCVVVAVRELTGGDVPSWDEVVSQMRLAGADAWDDIEDA